MFEDLQAKWLTDLYSSYKSIILHSVDEQLSTNGLILDLDSLPIKPYDFKELFIRWLISINKERIKRGDGVIITKEIVLRCPLWRMIKCPLRTVKLTKESLFGKTIGAVGTKGTVGTIGTQKILGTLNKK